MVPLVLSGQDREDLRIAVNQAAALLAPADDATAPQCSAVEVGAELRRLVALLRGRREEPTVAVERGWLVLVAELAEVAAPHLGDVFLEDDPQTSVGAHFAGVAAVIPGMM
ncbi:MAG: hypothetical protein GY719_26005 [bacterium]|nr:hypothetical protein [bacterium]